MDDGRRRRATALTIALLIKSVVMTDGKVTSMPYHTFHRIKSFMVHLLFPSDDATHIDSKGRSVLMDKGATLITL